MSFDLMKLPKWNQASNSFLPLFINWTQTRAINSVMKFKQSIANLILPSSNVRPSESLSNFPLWENQGHRWKIQFYITKLGMLFFILTKPTADNLAVNKPEGRVLKNGWATITQCYNMMTLVVLFLFFLLPSTLLKTTIHHICAANPGKSSFF